MTAIILQFPVQRLMSPMERARRTALAAIEKEESERAAHFKEIIKLQAHLEKPQHPGDIDDLPYE